MTTRNAHETSLARRASSLGGKRAGSKMEEMARVESATCSLTGSRNTARNRGWALHKSRRAWSKTADGGGGAVGAGMHLSSFASSSGFRSCVGAGAGVDIVVASGVAGCNGCGVLSRIRDLNNRRERRRGRFWICSSASQNALPRSCWAAVCLFSAGGRRGAFVSHSLHETAHSFTKHSPAVCERLAILTRGMHVNYLSLSFPSSSFLFLSYSLLPLFSPLLFLLILSSALCNCRSGHHGGMHSRGLRMHQAIFPLLVSFKLPPETATSSTQTLARSSFE
jgi:hypothetical protein